MTEGGNRNMMGMMDEERRDEMRGDRVDRAESL